MLGQDVPCECFDPSSRRNRGLKIQNSIYKKNFRLLTWHTWQVSQLSRLRLCSVFTVFLKYFSIIHCFLSELHSPYKADVDQGQLIYIIYLEDVFLFCPVLSNVFILIDMVVAARALAELRLVSVFARIPPTTTTHPNFVT